MPRLAPVFFLVILAPFAFAQNPSSVPGNAAGPISAPPLPAPGDPPILLGDPPQTNRPDRRPDLPSKNFAATPTPSLPEGANPPGGTTSGSGDEQMVKLQFLKTDVRDVLEFYALLTKRRLVLDNAINGEVNIVVSGQVPRSEAIQIIESNLLLNGITFVPGPGSILKVIGVGKNPRSSAIPIISEEADIPENEQAITFLVKLKYADPVELQDLLTKTVPPSQNQYTSFTALPKTSAVLMTESSSNIRQILKIVREIDLPPAEVVSEFIPLERADAKDVLDKMTALFEKQSNQTGSAPGGNRFPPSTPNTPPGTIPNAVQNSGGDVVVITGSTLSEDSLIVGKIRLNADIRTNRIHVVTRPVNMKFIRKLVHDFDIDADFGKPTTRTLKFIPVGEILDVVVDAIREPGPGSNSGGGNQGGAAGGNGLNGNRGNNSRTGSGSSSRSGGGGSSGGGDSSSVGGEELDTTPIDTTPESRVVGNTRLVADKNANALIVIGNEDVKSKIFKLLDELDQRIPQVMLHTVIGELNLDAKHQFGVDYILRNAGLGLSPVVLSGTTGSTSTSDGTGTGAVASGGTTTGTTSTGLASFNGTTPALDLNGLLNQSKVTQIAALGGSGIAGFISAGNSLTAVVSALEDTNRFHVVSRPSVFTRNNKKAIIASGQQIAIPQSIQSSLNSVNNSNGIVTNSSVTYKNVELHLEVVPLINSDKEVSLDILQREDEVAGSTRIDNNDIPTIATRYVRTAVSVPNEGTLVLGGLIKESLNRSRSGIPILSDIPLLGALFSTTSREKLRTELVVLIRPVVSWAPMDSARIRERAQEILNLEPDLESTLFPKGLREHADAEEMLRKEQNLLRGHSARATSSAPAPVAERAVRAPRTDRSPAPAAFTPTPTPRRRAGPPK